MLFSNHRGNRRGVGRRRQFDGGGGLRVSRYRWLFSVVMLSLPGALLFFIDKNALSSSSSSRGGIQSRFPYWWFITLSLAFLVFSRITGLSDGMSCAENLRKFAREARMSGSDVVVCPPGVRSMGTSRRHLSRPVVFLVALYGSSLNFSVQKRFQAMALAFLISSWYLALICLTSSAEIMSRCAFLFCAVRS